MFYVGQKVVCRGVFFKGNHKLAMSRVNLYGINLPEKGGVYTVVSKGTELGEPVLHLAEIGNQHLVPRYYPTPPGFPSEWFRPIVERKTDISIFTDMLTPKTEEVSA